MRHTDNASIRVENLVKHFGAIAAVRGISFTVACGATCALLGGNGAGKTTTLSMLMGLLLPTAGRVTILGHDIAAARYSILPRMNFTSPYADLPKRLTVRENLTVFAGLYNLDDAPGRIAELAADYALSAFIDRPYGNLSAGQRTRVAVAKALLNRPEVLLLDEPTASLDPDAGDLVRAHLMAYQRASGATFLLASHNMVEVERMADDVLMMRSGQIVDSGTPAALVARHGRASMEEVFLHIARNGGAERFSPGLQR